jgi:type I restriction enzyme M protein
MNAHFAAWRQKSATTLRQLKPGCHPKEVIATLSEDLLAHYVNKPLIDTYDVYQHLLDYWVETMQDVAISSPPTAGRLRPTASSRRTRRARRRTKAGPVTLFPRLSSSLATSPRSRNPSTSLRLSWKA